LAVHLVGAVVVALAIGWVSMWILGQHAGRPQLGRWAKSLAFLMVVQLLLGGTALIVVLVPSAWSSFVQWAIPSLHVAIGALLLACMVLLTISVHRFLCASSAPVGSGSSALSVTTA
jgi:heme A synthase